MRHVNIFILFLTLGFVPFLLTGCPGDSSDVDGGYYDADAWGDADAGGDLGPDGSNDGGNDGGSDGGGPDPQPANYACRAKLTPIAASTQGTWGAFNQPVISNGAVYFYAYDPASGGPALWIQEMQDEVPRKVLFGGLRVPDPQAGPWASYTTDWDNGPVRPDCGIGNTLARTARLEMIDDPMTYQQGIFRILPGEPTEFDQVVLTTNIAPNGHEFHTTGGLAMAPCGAVGFFSLGEDNL